MSRKAVSHILDTLCSLVPKIAIHTLFTEVKEQVSKEGAKVGKMQDWSPFSKHVRDLHSIDIATKPCKLFSWSVDKICMHIYVAWLRQRC